MCLFDNCLVNASICKSFSVSVKGGNAHRDGQTDRQGKARAGQGKGRARAKGKRQKAKGKRQKAKGKGKGKGKGNSNGNSKGKPFQKPVLKPGGGVCHLNRFLKKTGLTKKKSKNQVNIRVLGVLVFRVRTDLNQSFG
jgi:hypothetical protein